jgi:hypothetical protein
MGGSPLICHCCGTVLRPGSGELYVVRIEALADPFGPVIENEPGHDSRREMERLAGELDGLSPQEAMDQVHRRLTLYLCTPCYQRWIEDPTGA